METEKMKRASITERKNSKDKDESSIDTKKQREISAV
jgi:hypothetical protein